MQKLFIRFDGSFFEGSLKNPNCSIAEAAESTLYPGIKSYSYTNFEKLDGDIIAVYFKSFSNDVIGVLTNGQKSNISESELNEYLSDFRYDDHIFGFDIESTLDKGIQEKSINFDFMCEALNMNTPFNHTLIDTFNGYTYQFDDSKILVGYSSLTGQNQWSKYFERINPELIRDMYQYALEYWGDDIDAINKEVNLHCEALANIPQSVNNPLIPYFQIGNRIVNLAIINLILTGKGLNMDDFLNLTRDGVEIISITPTDITFKYHLVEFTFKRTGEFVSSNIPS